MVPISFSKKRELPIYPDMWFPEPRVAAVDRAERGQRLFRRT